MQREERQGTLKEQKYTYMRKVARCIHCNEELDVYNDENLKLLYDSFRQAHNLISLEDIREIPEMYNIGRGVLSSLLGWGVHTFGRYYEGYMPTKEYSDTLRKLHDNPSEYRDVLELGKDSMSEVAYNKSKAALQKLLAADTTPIMKVAGYLKQQKADMTGYRVQKLLYYIQGVSSVFCDEPLFLDPCQAWPAGPVFPEMFRKRKDDLIDATLGDLLSVDERAVVDDVLRCFGRYDGDTLVEFTHMEPPWLDARKGLSQDAHSDKVIPLESIVRYFSKVRDERGMTSITDMKSYAHDMFQIVLGGA